MYIFFSYQAALSVSEYTDKVDILSWKSKNARVHTQIKVRARSSVVGHACIACT